MGRFMAGKLRIPTHSRPPTPGDILSEDFLKPLGITQRNFAERLGISLPRLNEIINGKRGVTPDTALRLERAIGMSASFWLNLQQIVDLFDAMHSATAKDIRKIRPMKELSVV